MSDDNVQEQQAASEKPSTKGFIDQKSAQIKGDLKDMVRNDLIGVDQWKRSKIGSLTGFSIISSSIGKMGSTINESGERINSLFKLATARRELPDIPEEGSPEDRFKAGMQLYGLNETAVQVALRNTFWSTYLFAAIFVFYVVFMCWSFMRWPAHDIVMVLARLGPLPLVLVLLLKHAYTNWFFRNRRVGAGIIAFLRSKDYLPAK